MFQSSDPAQSCGEIETYSLSDDEKSDILLYHNKMRHYVASGREHQGNPGPQPSARNLNALVSGNLFHPITVKSFLNVM